jgi:hypothetical protein
MSAARTVGRTRAALASLAVGAMTLTACDQPAVVCPAIAYLPTLVVRLAADWPPGADRSVQVDCDSPCEFLFPSSTGGSPGSTNATTSTPVPVTGSEARVVLLRQPDSVVVTVSDPSGPLTSVEDELTWKRVGGSEDCGGPMEATVPVPAP